MDSELTKQDVARRQLVTSIRLFFENGDPVSIYTLASNAWEVIDVLCKKTGIDSLSNETREHMPKGKDLKKDYINSPYRNFFKHADRDPDARVKDFDEKKCDDIIFLGVEDYLRLFGQSPVEFQAFQLWYLAVKLEKVSDDALEKVREKTDQIFPNIRNLSREEKLIMGKEIMDEASTDSELIKDPRTENSL